MLNYRFIFLSMIAGLLVLTACSSPDSGRSGPGNGDRHTSPATFDGRAHLGEWVWIAVYQSGRSELESFGWVDFDEFAGSPADGWRQTIVGTWQNCTYGYCSSIGPAAWGELSLEGDPFELVIGFMNAPATDVRMLGLEFEYQVIDGQPAYIGRGEYYGSPAAIGLIRPDPSDVTDAAAGTVRPASASLSAQLTAGNQLGTAEVARSRAGLLTALKGLTP